jgi:nucleotide-binding universal stress UspA family protein
MQLRRIVVATDDSREGQAALLAAARLSQRCRSRVTALTVLERGRDEAARSHAVQGLTARIATVMHSLPNPPKIEAETALGLPGIEIGRFAEAHSADLVVLGRKHRNDLQRRMLGDTADAVARRSRAPCLFVMAGALEFERVLVALDGSERGLTVLLAAIDFARLTGAKLRAVCVEPAYENEDGVPRLLTGRSARLVETVDGLISSSAVRRSVWDRGDRIPARPPVVIHRGPIVTEILREIQQSHADLLFLGYHRGGPASIVDAGSVSRRLTHEAPCGVITIPL